MSTSGLQRYVSNLLSVHLGGLTIRENIRPDWLITKEGNRLELDFFIEELESAIEVQGEQHYRYIPFFHGSYKGYQKRVKWDNFKRATCGRAGIKLYEVADSLDALKTLESLLSTLVQTEHFEPTILDKRVVKSEISKTRKIRLRKAVKMVVKYFKTHYRKVDDLDESAANQQIAFIAKQYGLPKKQVRETMVKVIEEQRAARAARNRKKKERARLKKRQNTNGFIFIMESTSGHYRIGYSTKPEVRAESMRFMVPGHEAWLCLSIPSDNFRAGAAEMQSWFEDKHFKGHWYDLEDSDLEIIRGFAGHKNGVWLT